MCGEEPQRLDKQVTGQSAQSERWVENPQQVEWIPTRLLESQHCEPIYRFNSTTIKIPEGVFLSVETDKPIPRFIRKRKGLRLAGDEKVVGWGVTQSDHRNQSELAQCGRRSEQ